MSALSRNLTCTDPWGRPVVCGGVSFVDPTYTGGYRPPPRSEDNSRPDCAVNLPSFPINTKRDLMNAEKYIVKNNPVSCVGPALEALCSRIPVALRKNFSRKYRGWCNANTGRSGALMGLSGYSSKAQIVAEVQKCKAILANAIAAKSDPARHLDLMLQFTRCAANIVANTDAKAASILPTPFRQMWAAENKGGLNEMLGAMGADAVVTASPAGYSESANIFSQWVSAISNAASQLTNNYVQIRAATGKMPTPQPIISTDSFGGGNTLLYVGGGIALLAVLMMAKR